MDVSSFGVRFQIYPRTRKKRPVTLICYHVGSERKQITFPGDLDAAKKHCKELARKVTTGDAIHLTALDARIWLATKDAAAKLGRPPDAIVRDYVEAVQILEGTGTVLESVRAWRRQHATNLPAITLAELVPELKQHLAQKRRESVTIATLDTILVPLAAAFVNLPISVITTAELEKYLGTRQLAPRTINNHRAGIVRLFNFAKGRYLPKNQPTAADAIEEVSQPDRGAIAIFKPWEFSALLHGLAQAATRAETPIRKNRTLGLLRTLLIGGFTGARTVELCRMEASAIRTDPDAISSAYPHGYLEIKRGVAKRHRSAARRLIPIQPNLAKWLQLFPAPAGPVSPYSREPSFARAMSRAIRQINTARAKLHLPLLSRPENGCRHSYATYRLPILKSAAALAIEMNNSPQEIEENYHELAPPKDVEAWWQIEPAANILPFQIAQNA